MRDKPTGRPRAAWLVLAVALAVGACRARHEPAPVSAPDGSVPVPSGAIARSGLRPLAPDGGWFQTARDDAGVPTYLAVPMGATTKRPIVVGLHGAEDRPDWACSEWFGALGGRAFVVCPRGVPLRGGFVWSSVDQIVASSASAIALVRARFGPWVSDGPALYGGWSQAATLGPLVLAKRPDLFDAAVLVELGHTPLDARAAAAHVRASRARAVAVVCSTAGCARWCAAASPAMTGVRFACFDAGRRGHVFDGEVAKRVFDAARFVESGDARWSPLLPP